MYPIVPTGPSIAQNGKFELDNGGLFSSKVPISNVETKGSKKVLSPLVYIPSGSTYNYHPNNRPLATKESNVEPSRPPLDEGGSRPQAKTNVLRSKKKVRQVVPVDPLELLEPDAYGTEMGKDARVWKIYVKEADKWDEELIDGWNRSLDVILVFAALFSAISAAFIIESSKMLTEDPNTATVNVLLSISQKLDTVVNGPSGNASALPVTTASLQSGSVSRGHAVLINTLWYFSLSLSVATSLLSMLAKDWCHSFRANRTGHSYDQALRRQRKWTMIEQWKMQELITVLPFVIHSSLLLFAIGLCIYIWDINRTVAIPVICVTCLASAFYIWSSVMASIVKLFPYTTILSRIMQSDYMYSKYEAAKKYDKVRMYSVLGGVSAAASVCLYALCWVVTALFYLLHLPVITVRHIWHMLPWHKPGDPNHLKSYLGIMKKLVSGGIHPKLHNWLTKVHRSFSPPRAPCGSDHDRVTSLALRWLIQNCENVSSVDAALQAIAGASAKTPKEPLESCRAVLHIVRRLASDPDTEEAERNNQLYTRALTILGSGSKRQREAKGAKVNVSSAEITLRNFQPEHERQIDALITSTDFPAPIYNLGAFTLGNNATSLGFRLLKGEDRDAPNTFAMVTGFLLNHIGSTAEQLNSATLRSLTNTTVLLTSCSPVSLLGPDETDRCMRSCLELTSSNPPVPHMESVLDVCTAFLVCLVLHSPSTAEKPNQPPCINTDTRVERAASFLTDQHSRSYLAKSAFYHVAMAEVLFGWDSDKDSKMAQDISNRKQQLSIIRLCESLKIQRYTLGRRRTINNLKQASFSEFLTAVDQVCKLTAHSKHCASSSLVRLSPPVYCLFVWAVCLTRAGKNQEMCDKLLSNLAFPTLTAEFATVVDEVLPMLWATYTGHGLGAEAKSRPWRFSTSTLWQVEGTDSDWLATRPKHFAATQLWVLLCLVGSSSNDEQKRLKAAIERQTKLDLGDSGMRTFKFKQELENYIIKDYRREHLIRVYSARVVKCIHEDRASVTGSHGQRARLNEWEGGPNIMSQVDHELRDVPLALQGLASFVGKPRAIQPIRTTSTPTPPEGRSHRWSKSHGPGPPTGLRKRSRASVISHSLSSIELQKGMYQSLEAQESTAPLVQPQSMEEPEQMPEDSDHERHNGHVSISVLPSEPSSNNNHPAEK